VPQYLNENGIVRISVPPLPSAVETVPVISE